MMQVSSIILAFAAVATACRSRPESDTALLSADSHARVAGRADAAKLKRSAQKPRKVFLKAHQVKAIIKSQDGGAALTDRKPTPMPARFAARLMRNYPPNVRAVRTGEQLKAEMAGLGLTATEVDESIGDFDTSVKDQGDRGTCGAFAAVAALENLAKRNKDGIEADFSEEHLWWAQGSDSAPMETTLARAGGAWLTDEDNWPYGEDGVSSQGEDYIRLRSWDVSNKLSTAFANGSAVVGVFGTNVSWDDNPNGVISTAAAAWEDTDHGIHAVAPVGIHIEADGSGYVTFKNSWGSSWGDEGYGYLPLDYCTENRCEWYVLSGADYNW